MSEERTALDYESFEEITEALYKWRDKIGEHPYITDQINIDSLGEKDLVKLNEHNKFLDELYDILDICGYDVETLNLLSKKD